MGVQSEGEDGRQVRARVCVRVGRVEGAGSGRGAVDRELSDGRIVERGWWECADWVGGGVVYVGCVGRLVLLSVWCAVLMVWQVWWLCWRS